MRAVMILLGVMFVLYQANRVARSGSAPSESDAPAPWEGAGVLPLVTVMVAAWNAVRDVERFVEAFRCLSYPNLELVVCAGGNDGTWKQMEKCGGADVIMVQQEAGEGKQRALAKAFKKSRGKIIFLTDIDCELTDESFTARVAPIIQGTAKVVTGPYRPLSSQEAQPFVWAQWAAQRTTYPDHLETTRGLVGANTAIHRDLIEETGSFTATAPSGTDYTLAKQLLNGGHELWFEPQAPIATVYPETVRAYVRQQRRWIRNVAVLGHRYQEKAEVRAAVKTMAQPWVLLICAALGLGIWEFWVLGGLLGAHALSNRVIYLRRAGRMVGAMWILRHYVADLWAAGAATWSIASGQVRW